MPPTVRISVWRFVGAPAVRVAHLRSLRLRGHLAEVKRLAPQVLDPTSAGCDPADPAVLDLVQAAQLKDIPVVLMSAKGDQVGERFVKVMGIVDYITKPFSPDAITAVVQHTIEKYARAPGSPTAEGTGETTLDGKHPLPTLRQPAPSVDAMASAISARPFRSTPSRAAFT